MSSPLFLEQFRKHVVNSPDKTCWSFCDDVGVVNDSFTYAELERATTALARHLTSPQCGLKQGDRVLLVFFPGLHFTASLLACFKAGIVAVPVFPPDPTRLKKDLNHFVSIQESSGSRVVLTHSAYNYAKKLAGVANIFSSSGEKWPTLQWLQVDDVLTKSKAATTAATATATLPAIGRDDIAFLQYTSGSTSEPKGVMISHGNLAHNLTLIIRELGADVQTVNVSWLPQYHDMGLIGSYLGALYCGGTGYYLSPISFLKNPLVWMSCMSKYKGTHSQAPNFAFALSARKYREARVPPAGLDLSAVKHVINAAEPVDAVAMADFCRIYGAMGLPADVIKPTYGLAEHTVFVASGGCTLLCLSRPALESNTVQVLRQARVNSPESLEFFRGESSEEQNLVGCGFPARGEGVDLRIVGDDCAALEEGRVGEIWIDSPSKAQGYWGRAEQSREDFSAQLTSNGSSSSSGGGYLRTGDLGFLFGGELFICGRIKDLIIVRGSNHYPQDLERTAEKAEEAFLRPGCSAAFAIKTNSHTEGVVLVAEVKENVPASKHAAIVDSLKLAISKDHGLGLSCVCLLPTRSILKTTSGKITRAGNRRAFLDGSLKVLYRWEGQEAAAGAGAGAVVDTALDVAQLSPPTWIDAGPGSAGDEAHEGQGLVGMDLPAYTAEEVRALPLADILVRLEALLLNVAGSGPCHLSTPVDPDAALVVLGLDSMTVVQFKGAVEGTLHCEIPDEFMFTSLATLRAFAIAVQHGQLTPDQRAELDAGMAPAGTGTTTIQLKDEPCCPWFIGHRFLCFC